MLTLRCARQVRLVPSIPRLSHNLQRRTRSTKDDPSTYQAQPLTGYWAELLGDQEPTSSEPLSKTQPLTRTAPEPSTPESLPKTEEEARLEKARVVFGSQIGGPGERQDQIDAASRNVAGITVPPKPKEPENCCMSGCVNCVWDLYRDELEEWVAKSAEAREHLAAQKGGEEVVNVSESVDGSDANGQNELAKPEDEDEMFANVPVGMREFMRTEKLLKGQKEAKAKEEAVKAKKQEEEDAFANVPPGMREFMRMERQLKQQKEARAKELPT